MSELKRTGVWVAQWMEDLGLTPNQTKLYAEIVSLDAKGGCFASNEYLGMVLRLKRDTISRLVSQLKKKGLLKQTGFDGRKRFLKPLLPNSQKGSELDLNPKQRHPLPLKERPSSGFRSKSELVVDTKPSSKYQLDTNIQNYIRTNQNAGSKNERDEWLAFLAWSEERLSLTTRVSLAPLGGPEVLTGLQLSYWERFKSNPS
ncbi:helix-turn-helix domain-containing protein [Leptospira brenneri]|uniref:Helix-turn-helix domain-containing protein n=1 Tax=Leptospira brenneri TaxID=2023182 RepID=A0A2M9XWZ8_9LEPT|nr:helix-turn-helix domain-containing protein [Leptospira brenneri]PJZ43865.1 DNA-binding protein [Leptospira brenneri]TGK92443.1 helix-turn-helix domain-containing protein [Leptospira brenneri]